MTDFPRGWTLNNFAAAGTAASITIAATAGVVHVLDSIDAKLVGVAPAAIFGPFVKIIVAAVTIVQWQLLIPSGTPGTDALSFSGLDIASAPGGTIQVTFDTVAAASTNEMIVAQGHDI